MFMLGWRNLLSYQQLDLYYKWEKQHAGYLTDRLREEYESFSSYRKNNITYYSGFASLIGFPLFLATVFILLFAEPKNSIVVIAIIFGIGFLVRWFISHVAEIACQEFFCDTEFKILHEFVEQKKLEDIKKASSAEEIEDITAFYDFCDREIVSANFKYYEKVKESKRFK